MPVQILDVAPSSYTADDQRAYDAAHTWLRRIPELFITARSLQRQIGISEVGSDCRKCVARKLALVYKKPDGSWFPFIGTAVHDALEKGFAERWPDEYKLENRLDVHSYKSLNLGGSCDMAYLTEGILIVNDWKIVGERKLKEAARGKVTSQYRVQAMLYGYGWEQKGETPTHVALSFLPRDKDLADAQVVMMRYDKQVALDAIKELEKLIDIAEIMGWDAVIQKQPKASFCFDCKKYEQEEDGDLSSLV